MSRFMLLATAVLAAAVLSPATAGAQNFVLDLPEVSQQASVGQRIGLTDISISYHRPGVNGRTIWGDLVPYDQVWRAGANENTVITFSSPVTVQGKPLAAGAYGLHMIPTKKDWTIIFSNQSQAWGSFSYDQKEDALRVTVTPEAAPMEERLSYRMDNPTDKAVTVALDWEKLRVPFTVEVDVPKVVAADLRDRQLRGLSRFYWQGWNQAAAWCLRNDTNLDEAMTWVDRSIAMSPQFNNMMVKASLLDRKGDSRGSQDFRTRALAIGTETDINLYAYQLMGQGKQDDAMKMFQKNAKDYPKSWNVWDSLGEAYATMGRKSDAVSSYRKALGMTNDETQKKRIEAAIAKLR